MKCANFKSNIRDLVLVGVFILPVRICYWLYWESKQVQCTWLVCHIKLTLVESRFNTFWVSFVAGNLAVRVKQCCLHGTKTLWMLLMFLLPLHIQSLVYSNLRRCQLHSELLSPSEHTELTQIWRRLVKESTFKHRDIIFIHLQILMHSYIQ